MTLQQYIDKVNSRFKTGITTEHSFRGDLQELIEKNITGIMATNEPKHIDCGAPDYIITKKNIPLGYIEAKDINADLDNKNYKEQFDRYKNSLDNLIITDYLTFNFYKDGKKTSSIILGKVDGKKIIPLTENFEQFIALLKDFCSYTGQTIRSAQKLSKMMAGKARMLANIIENALNSDEEKTIDSTLHAQMKAFKDILIHDITIKEFADIYAQTIAYGMFAARLHDPSLDNFTRQEAAELIPKSNPFLRKLFGYIAGPDIDERIIWVVDALADIFRATDVADLLKNFGSSTQQTDPIIHFYETFLAEYDPKLRKARGVWYTPEPVVNFIVRAVDDILKTEFNLPDGLADRSKTKVKVNVQGKIVEQSIHKVQILDPAAGTGTFLAEIIKQIYKKFTAQQGSWSSYVEEHLIPRLNGFELLMASYAMAHLKLDMLLTETGYKPKTQQRLKVYLTNSLEEHHPDTGTLFANWLSTEANEANHIKRDTPVMVVLGNPPYAVSSSNKSDWIQNLIADYKKDLNEKNIQPLSDDYIKFIRFGEHFIERNGEGILAFISNNSFIDGVIHRQMRKHLLETFDKIYILDLHGNSKRKETAPDGSKDENVFDILPGVSINIFVKNNINKKKNPIIFHSALFGKREDKYQSLFNNSISKLSWEKLNPKRPYYLYIQISEHLSEEFQSGINIESLFNIASNGIQTKRDNLFVEFQAGVLERRIEKLLSTQLDQSFIKEYEIKDSSSYPLIKRIKNSTYDRSFVCDFIYRPLDERKIYYDRNLLGRPFYKVMQHLLFRNNYCLVLGRQGQATGDGSWDLVFITRKILDTNLFYRGGNMSFPLYLYPENKAQQTLDGKQERTPNLNKEIVNKIAEGLGLTYVPEKTKSELEFAPIDLLDYIYAVLHSPTYRNKYKEFLKIDFPRVPYPKNKKDFWQLVKLGGQLRQIHLLESDAVNNFITTFAVDGNNTVEKIRFDSDQRDNASHPELVSGSALTPKTLKQVQGDSGKVWINETQYFDKVPQVAWGFYIGGYQPAQKWLKDRKGRTLNFDDIQHYQKIIVALSETDKLMKEIDKIKI